MAPNDYLSTANSYEKSRLALLNAMRGDMGASFRSVFKPESLTPAEKKDFLSFVGDHPVVKALIETVTNPFVLLGAALSFRYPISKMLPENTFKYAQKYISNSDVIPWLDNKIGTPSNIFGKQYPQVYKYMQKIMDRISNWGSNQTTAARLARDKFMRTTGSAMTETEEIIAHHMVQGHHRPDGGSLNRFLFPAIKEKMGIDLAGKSLLRPDVLSKMEPKRAKALEQFVKDIQAQMKGMGGEIRPIFEGNEAVRAHMDDVLSSRNFATGNIKVPKGAKKLGHVLEEDFFPQYYKGTNPMYQRQMQDIGQATEEFIMSPAGRQQMAERYGGAASKSLLERITATLPDMDDAAKHLLPKGYLNEDVFKAMQDYQATYSRGIAAQVEAVFSHATADDIAGSLKNLLMTPIDEGGFEIAEAIATKHANAAAKLWRIANKAEAQAQFMKAAQGLGEIPQYRTRIFQPLEEYIHSMAPTYAGAVPTTEAPQGLWSALKDEGLKMAGPYREVLFQDYAPHLTGRPGSRFAHQLAAYNNHRLQMWEQLKKPWVEKLFNKTKPGQQAHKYMIDVLEGTRGNYRPGSTEAGLTAMLYQGTMAYNLGPPTQNSVQTIITTLPLVGLKAWFTGLVRTLPKMGRYFKEIGKLRKAGYQPELARDLAMRKVWPEFANNALAGHSMMEGGTAAATGIGGGAIGGVKQGIETAKRVGMAPFSGTELFNRVMSWESGLARAEAAGTPLTKAYEYAANVVRETQFASGPMGLPHMVLNWPSPFRQFTQFPLRMANFLAQSTKYGGEPGRNWGVIGRSMLASGLAYEGAKHVLGTDISQSLTVGALPAPSWEGAPFYPMPLVPPALGVAGSLGQAVISGDYGRLPRALSVMVPGGAQLHRTYRTWAPSRADYSQYNTTGKIPLYDDKGFMIGRYTPMQLFLKSVGINTTDALAEQEMTKYLLSQKEQLRTYRREYLSALSANNLEKAQSIQDDYKRRYPGLGPLSVKKSDIRAVERRRLRTRLQRVVEGLPKETQPMFQDMLAVIDAEEMTNGLNAGGEYLNVMYGK